MRAALGLHQQAVSVGTKAELPTHVLANIWLREVSPCLRLKNQIPPLYPPVIPKETQMGIKKVSFLSYIT